MTIALPLKRILTGLTMPQEYLCVPFEKVEGQMQVLMTLVKQQHPVDITKRHILLGYSPVIIAINFGSEQPTEKTHLWFKEKDLEISEGLHRFPSDQRAQARLILRLMKTVNLNHQNVGIYTGEYGKHYFLNYAHQVFNRFLYAVKPHTKDNITLKGNLYDQVRIAYSIPRMISIITLAEGGEMNMFPTDLHGPLDESIYLSSLRTGGKANDQVMRIRKLVISEMDSLYHNEAYGLGKNHTKDLADPNHFQIFPTPSRIFNCPIPVGAVSYRELELSTSFNLGIHTIHTYRIVSHTLVDQDKVRLAHVHQYYAQWRENENRPLPLLFRER